MPIQEALDACRIGSGWTVKRRTFCKRLLGIVHGQGVLTNDVAFRIDAIGDGHPHARNFGIVEIKAGELAVFEQEAVLMLRAIDVKTYDVTASVNAFCAGLRCDLAGHEPGWTAFRCGSGRALDVNRNISKLLGRTLRTQKSNK